MYLLFICRGKIHFYGPWKGLALKIKTFVGTEMATSEASAIWDLKFEMFASNRQSPICVYSVIAAAMPCNVLRPYLINFDATGSPCHELTS